MVIGVSLKGRLRNTSLPKSNALLPLFEAVVNAIQAVDEAHANNMGAGYIEVEIVRGPQLSFDFDEVAQGPVPVEPIRGFIIRDNGIGFTDDNITSCQSDGK